MAKTFFLEEKILQILFTSETHTVMVLGGVDTGKTTLVEEVVDFLAKDFEVGIVDCDLGQSHLGPPTTIAWGLVKGEFPGWEKIEVEDFYFVGSTSPFGHLLQTLTGTKYAFDRAKEKAEKIIVDTSGFIAEPEGRILKENKIDLLKPEIIFALQNKGELEGALSSFNLLERPLIFRLSVPEEVTKKSPEKRAEYRKEIFDKYFSHLFRLEFTPGEIGIRRLSNFSGWSEDYRGLICSLRNKENEDLALGIIEEFTDSEVVILTPWEERKEIKLLVLSKTKYEE